MSDPGKAVFLSYASQDAGAAKRICDTLRAAGIEVWFDQSELVGGDAWDQQIRRQIRECALLIPVVSQTTQGRREAYFRLEWKLADERTHLMASGTPFLLPVTIDETKGGEALVPDSFLAVQWTKAPGGELPPSFCARVKQLLESPEPAARGRDGRSESQEPWPAHRRRAGLWWLLPIFGVTMALLLVLRERRGERSPANATAVPAVSEARQLARRAVDLLHAPEGVNRERLEAADELCKRALALDPLDGKVFALAAQVDANWVYYQMDKSEARQQQAKNRAARAAVLAPGEPVVRFAQAVVYGWVIATPPLQAEAERMLRELGTDPEWGHEARVVLGTVLLNAGRPEEAAALFEESGDLGLAGWAYCAARRIDDALRLADAQLARGHSATALQQKSFALYSWREDLAAAADVVRQFTAQELLADSSALVASQLALFQRDAPRLLEIALAFPREYYSHPGGFSPRRYFSGWAHELAGRPELARTEWRAALATVRELRALRPADADLVRWEATLHALLGNREEGEAALRLLRSLVRQPEGTDVFQASLVADALLGRKEEALRRLSAARFTPRDWLEIHASLRYGPEFSTLREEPRYKQFLRDTLPAGAKPLEEASPLK